MRRLIMSRIRKINPNTSTFSFFMRKHSVYTVVLVLIVALLTNSIGISFKAETYTHELDHVRQVHSTHLETHLEAHQDSIVMDGTELDGETHLCPHAASQYQPFYFIRLPLVPCLPGGSEKLAGYIPLALPDSILESPYHPPRII